MVNKSVKHKHKLTLVIFSITFNSFQETCENNMFICSKIHLNNKQYIKVPNEQTSQTTFIRVIKPGILNCIQISFSLNCIHSDVDLMTSELNYTSKAHTDYAQTVYLTILLACTPGYYGSDCNTPCGRCLGDVVCHNVNGYCHNGCKQHWMGLRCDGKYSTKPKHWIIDPLICVNHVLITCLT